ncbi:MAG: hypothetical protein IPP90_09810 [Gemmatimonadaceae bacterium]|nr:hypothetical protein [Gemmatimonadaceae bacterium]
MSLVFSVVIAFVLSSGSWRPASVDEPCQPLSPPKRMPSVGQLVDSLSLLARVQALDSAASGEVVVSVTPSQPPGGYLVDLPNPTPRQDSVVEFVLAAMRPASRARRRDFACASNTVRRPPRRWNHRSCADQ